MGGTDKYKGYSTAKRQREVLVGAALFPLEILYNTAFRRDEK
jgi:hypothetical protein